MQAIVQVADLPPGQGVDKPSELIPVFETLFALVIIAFFIERALSVIFDIKKFAPTLSKHSVKPLIAILVSVAFTFSTGFDAMSPVLKLVQGASTNSIFGMFATGLVIAGGSAGAVKLFQDILGFSKKARDQIRDAETAELAQRKAVAEHKTELAKTEQKRVEAQRLREEAELQASLLETQRQIALKTVEVRQAEATASAAGGAAPSALVKPLAPEVERLLREGIGKTYEEWADFLARRDRIEGDLLRRAAAYRNA